MLGTATEQLSLKLGQTLSGLLNASFGNAVEIIVGIAALLQGSRPSVLLQFYGTHLLHRRASHRPDFGLSPLQLLLSPRTESAPQLLGSILSNILLVLGCSFLAGK